MKAEVAEAGPTCCSSRCQMTVANFAKVPSTPASCAMLAYSWVLESLPATGADLCPLH